MFGPLTERELAQIRRRLPSDIQALKDKYPQAVNNTSEAWGQNHSHMAMFLKK